MKLSESVRHHVDWWGQCRTCEYWMGDRSNNLDESNCSNFSSPMFEKITSNCGYCPNWDAADIEAAEIVMQWSEKQKKEGRPIESPDMQLERDGK